MFDVEICVATYRHVVGLERLIRSIDSSNFGDFTVRIIVVDNDPDQTARDVAESLGVECRFPIVYYAESRRGISFARNCALDNSTARHIAFVDDDEILSREWFLHHVQGLDAAAAHVSFGPVKSVFESGAPKWAEFHPAFQYPTQETGTFVTHGASNNVVMRSSVIEEGRFRFSVEFGLTGGGDTEFFKRLYESGIKMVWCQEAEVLEYVPCSRTTHKWVNRRSFRAGQGYERIFGEGKKKLKIWKLLGGLLLSAPSLLISKLLLNVRPDIAIPLKAKVYRFLGRAAVRMKFGGLYEEYSATSYRNEQGATNRRD